MRGAAGAAQPRSLPVGPGRAGCCTWPPHLGHAAASRSGLGECGASHAAPSSAPAPGAHSHAPSSCTLRSYSPEKLFEVVSQVQHYQQFVPWCVASRITRRQGDSALEAELEVGFQVFVER